MKTVFNVFIPRPKFSRKIYSTENSLNLEDICQKTGYKLKVKGYLTPRILLLSEDNAIAQDCFGNKLFIVDDRDLKEAHKWEMVLEKLAYGFLDYATRETVRHFSLQG